ncbi:MAG: hypothetical protein CTY39_02645 [Hyphomicrobium sp.]|nr:MAG: hypothetical protein CTY39_02645 [Hyphomicrobium sp.]
MRKNAENTHELSSELCISVGAGELADLFGRSLEWVRELKTRGVIQNTGTRSRPQYDLVISINSIFADHSRRVALSGKKAARATDARTREIELRIEQKERDLISVGESVDIISELAEMFRAEFAGLPARFSSDQSKQAAVRAEAERSLRTIEASAKQAIQRLQHGASK